MFLFLDFDSQIFKMLIKNFIKKKESSHKHVIF